MLIRSAVQGGEFAPIDCFVQCPDRGHVRHVKDLTLPANVVLLYLAFASVESHFMRAFSDLKGILRGSSFFTLGGVLKKMKKLIRFIDN